MTAPVLLPFSGGADCTAVLWLITASRPVHCVFIPHRTRYARSNKHRAERVAVDNVLAWVRKQPGRQPVTLEVIDTGNPVVGHGQTRTQDDLIEDALCSILKARPRIVMVADGSNMNDTVFRTPDDWGTMYHPHSRSTGMFGGLAWDMAWLTATRPEFLRGEWGRWIAKAGRSDWTYQTPLTLQRKPEIMASMPRELADLTISCLYPKRRGNKWVPCGECGKDRERDGLVRVVYTEPVVDPYEALV